MFRFPHLLATKRPSTVQLACHSIAQDRESGKSNSECAESPHGIKNPLQAVETCGPNLFHDVDGIPEHPHYANGYGAMGDFNVSIDAKTYTSAVFLSQVGQVTKVAVRFSTSVGYLAKRFDTEFYTREGMFDLVGNSINIFQMLDPEPMALTDGAGTYTYKMVNSSGDGVYVRFRWTSIEKNRRYFIQTMDGESPDYLKRDLFDRIKRTDFPSWKLSLQVMTFDRTSRYPENPFDITQLWDKEDFPLILIGTLTLNENPVDYFTEMEQLHSSPLNVVPGIELRKLELI